MLFGKQHEQRAGANAEIEHRAENGKILVYFQIITYMCSNLTIHVLVSVFQLQSSSMKIQCFLLLLAVVVVDLVTASKAITPVVFLPGYFGSQLIVTIDNEAIIPASCQVEGLNVPVGLPFAAMFNVTLLAKAPNCIFDLLATDMNCGDNSACVFSSKAGISVSSNDFGGFRGVEPVYWSFPRLLESWGYKLGVNLFGAPYDYRFMSVKSIIASGLVQALMDLVEKAYHLSGGKKVVLMGHSNGGPTLYSFFSASAADSTLMTLQWKDKYVAAMIGLSGNVFVHFVIIVMELCGVLTITGRSTGLWCGGFSHLYYCIFLEHQK